VKASFAANATVRPRLLLRISFPVLFYFSAVTAAILVHLRAPVSGHLVDRWDVHLKPLGPAGVSSAGIPLSDECRVAVAR
jgi:hypothetical protein